MSNGLTAVIVVNVPAEPGVGLFADCATIEECAQVQNSMIANEVLDLYELMASGVVQAFVQPTLPTPQPRPANQPEFDWAPIIEPSC